MPRGFIQIPILIAIILGMSALGMGGYFVTQRANTQSQSAIAPNSTTNEQVASTTVVESKDDDRNSKIESLQKQIADLKEKVDTPRTTEQMSSVTTPVKEIVQSAIATTTAIINTFPCSKFNALTGDIWSTALQIIEMYEDDGAKENPSKDDFDYPYNKTNLQKTTFYSTIDRLNQKIDLLDIYDGVFQAKTDLNKAADGFRVAFDLKLQGYRLANNDAFVYVSGYKILPQNNIDQARLNINQAGAKFTSALDYLSAGKDLLNTVKKNNGCN